MAEANLKASSLRLVFDYGLDEKESRFIKRRLFPTSGWKRHRIS